VENELFAMNFERVSAYRPAGLLCHRQERRVVERIVMTVLRPKLWPKLKRVAVPTDSVAKVSFCTNAFFRKKNVSCEDLKKYIIRDG
jgi:hypothetical protein